MQSANTNSPFAEVIGLGGVKSEHKPTNRSRIINLITGFVLLGLAPLALILSAWMAYDAYNHYGLNKVMDSGFILPLILGIIFVPLGLWILIQAFLNWKTSAVLYENGFAYLDRQGLRQIKWADIESVKQNIVKYYRYGRHVRTTYLYTIQLNDKGRITIDNKFPNVETLGKAITDGAAKALFPAYMTALKSGQRVTFGPLALDAQGLYSGNKSLTWQEIKAVKINKGIISVRKEGGWFNWVTVTVPQIPNFWIFVDLVSRFTKLE
jgi:hypothetical protein